MQASEIATWATSFAAYWTLVRFFVMHLHDARAGIYVDRSADVRFNLNLTRAIFALTLLLLLIGV